MIPTDGSAAGRAQSGLCRQLAGVVPLLGLLRNWALFALPCAVSKAEPDLTVVIACTPLIFSNL